MILDLNTGQKKATSIIRDWYHGGDWKDDNMRAVSVDGEAGTGKTFMVNQAIDRLGLKREEVLFCAYTGQASLNLIRKNIPARTLHKSFYDLVEEDLLDDRGNPVTKMGLPVRTPKFIPKSNLDHPYKLIINDEGGMTPDGMLNVMESFGVPILGLGDKGQLPPIFGESRLMNNPIYTLTEHMRQKAGDKILDLALTAKHGYDLKIGKHGDNCVVMYEEDLTDDMLLEADVILCSRNKTRENFNKYIRGKLLKRRSFVPTAGDIVVCRQNNWKQEVNGINLVNGLRGRVVHPVELSSFKQDEFEMDFQPEFMNASFFKNLKVDYAHFKAPAGTNTPYHGLDKFEYAWAITVHLSQGSEYPYVIVYEEVMNRNTHNRLLYTAITRAKARLIIVKQKPNYWG